MLGAGDDTFVGDPGDGSDTVEGDAGNDTMIFNGAAGGRADRPVRKRRPPEAVPRRRQITMDTAGVERVDVNALGGADVVTTNDLSGTGVTAVNVGLGADGQADRVVVNGTTGDDAVAVSGNADSVKIGGLASTVQILQPEVANDRLELNTLAGADNVNAAGLAAGAIQLIVDGGAGDDTLAGAQDVETLQGGEGNDSLDGNGGNDLGLLGAGDDTFVWDPGDGSDTVEGDEGNDTMVFNGAASAERIDLAANGGRLDFVRSPGSIRMDTAGVERVEVNALGGADAVTVNDLSGTDVTDVKVDLAGALGGTGGDGEDDHLVVNGRDVDDALTVAGDAAAVTVSSASTRVTLRHHEPNDELVVDGLDGNDHLIAPGLVTAVGGDVIALTLDGGAGDDELFGGRGADLLLGGDGNDVLAGFKGDDLTVSGAGDDRFEWDPGDGSDLVAGGDGFDTLAFIGANVAERIDLSRNGTSRVLFTRDVANVTMDLAGVEQVDFAALGGADTVTVDDLTGTDLAVLNVDLEVAFGVDDGEPDRIVVNATDGDDAIEVSGNAEVVKTGGLAAEVVILHPDVTNDRLEINTLDGMDTVNADDLAAGAIQLLIDGAPAR